MTIYSTATEIRDILVAAGVRATTDPRTVDPPCVLVVPESARFDTNCEGEGTTRWSLVALGNPPGASDTLQSVAKLVAGSIAAIPRIEAVAMTSYSTDSGQQWPAMRMTLTTVSSWT